MASPDGHCSHVCVPACCGGEQEGALLGKLLGVGGDGWTDGRTDTCLASFVPPPPPSVTS